MTKRYTAMLLAAIMIIPVLTGCGNKNVAPNTQIVTEAPTQIAEDTTSFKLGYCQSDPLDPYKSTSLNNQTMQDLVFDSLFTLDEGYEAQPDIATGYSYTDATTLVVTIRTGIKFSNGKPVTADDIVRSFRLAKESPHWKNSLAPISGASADSVNTITFRLNYPDPNAHALLTFAIAASGTDDDNYPIGSGRYKFATAENGVMLVVNENHNDFRPHFTKISLVNITTEESTANAVNIGNITYAYRDLAEGNNIRISCNKKAVNLNNLVYIGINGNVGITANPAIRKAISLATDRETMVKSAYRGFARPAVSVFNPATKYGKMTSLFSSTADIPAAKQAIAQSGYGKSELKIDILVNENPNRRAMATLLKQQLQEVGFKVTINKENGKSYREYVKNRYFDIYIGETKIPDDMRLTSFFSAKGATNYGIARKGSKTIKSYYAFLNGDGELGSFLLDFSEEMPFIPVLYRQGMICYSKAMHGDMQSYNGNYFSNIQDWYCS